MADTVESLTLLQQLEARRAEETNALASFVEKREAERTAFEKREASEGEKPSDEDRSAFNVAEEEFGKEFDRRDAELEVLKRRIREQEAIEERRQQAARNAAPQVEIVREPLTYERGNAHEVSYFRDLAARYDRHFAAQTQDAMGAMDRLERHSKEMSVEMPKREAARERRAQEQVERAEREFTGSVVGMQRRGLPSTPFERNGREGMEQRVNPNRTDGQGGYFVRELAAA